MPLVPEYFVLIASAKPMPIAPMNVSGMFHSPPIAAAAKPAIIRSVK